MKLVPFLWFYKFCCGWQGDIAVDISRHFDTKWFVIFFCFWICVLYGRIGLKTFPWLSGYRSKISASKSELFHDRNDNAKLVDDAAADVDRMRVSEQVIQSHTPIGKEDTY